MPRSSSFIELTLGSALFLTTSQHSVEFKMAERNDHGLPIIYQTTIILEMETRNEDIMSNRCTFVIFRDPLSRNNGDGKTAASGSDRLPEHRVS